MGKKNPFVFTIGFDKSDPDHVYVTELLNTTEKKAKLIVAAILAYTGRTDETGNGSISMEPDMLRPMMQQIIREEVRKVLEGQDVSKINREMPTEVDLMEEEPLRMDQIPSIIMQSIGSIMTYSMNRILIEFSSTATAVFGVYFKLQSFFFMPVFGLNNGITPIIAYNYGAQQRKRMIRTIKISLTTAFCLTFIGFLCFEGIPQVLLGMFNASADMLKIGVPALRIIGIHYLIAWFCIIAGTVFQALGKAVFSMIVSIMRQLVVLIPAAYILSKIGGLHVVWWSFPIAEVISFIVSMAFLIRIYKTIISKIPEGKL